MYREDGRITRKILKSFRALEMEARDVEAIRRLLPGYARSPADAEQIAARARARGIVDPDEAIVQDRKLAWDLGDIAEDLREQP